MKGSWKTKITKIRDPCEPDEYRQCDQMLESSNNPLNEWMTTFNIEEPLIPYLTIELFDLGFDELNLSNPRLWHNFEKKLRVIKFWIKQDWLQILQAFVWAFLRLVDTPHPLKWNSKNFLSNATFWAEAPLWPYRPPNLLVLLKVGSFVTGGVFGLWRVCIFILQKD